MGLPSPWRPSARAGECRAESLIRAPEQRTWSGRRHVHDKTGYDMARVSPSRGKRNTLRRDNPNSVFLTCARPGHKTPSDLMTGLWTSDSGAIAYFIVHI